MAAKRALVVDDSKSARAFLSRVLQRYDLTVDGVETAEQAIEYLAHQRPDVIFMDHLMPGMDGLQAVRAIKNDPRTATIPIMMYTSQEGELYLSQARALGAIGVLPKQIRHADLSKALQQLRLTDAPRDESGIATVRAPAVSADDERLPTDTEPPPDVTVERRGPDRPRLPAMSSELRSIIEAMLAHQTRDLRHFVVDSMETHSDRIVGDVRLLLQDETVTPRLRWPVRAGLVAAAIAALGLLFVLLWWRERTERGMLAAQLHDTETQLASTQNTVDSLRNAQAVQAAAARPEAPAGTADTAASQLVVPVPFGETALGGARVEPLQNLLAQLASSGFRGTVQVRSYPGRFCLSQGPGETLTLASADTPYAKCDQVGSPRDPGGTEPRESLSFANMLASARKSANGNVDIQVGNGSPAETAVPYPPVTDNLTAGEWNQAAAANNRVEVRWQASR
jgi:CheY-like chemotaxis protein